jgi:hypothetical protein
MKGLVLQRTFKISKASKTFPSKPLAMPLIQIFAEKKFLYQAGVNYA